MSFEELQKNFKIQLPTIFKNQVISRSNCKLPAMFT